MLQKEAYNMNDKVQTAFFGVSWKIILTVIFIFLKAMGIASCSWMWIISPLWLPDLAAMAVISVILIISVIF
jgi:hypothetical protein